jgi:hypothetical protein
MPITGLNVSCSEPPLALLTPEHIYREALLGYVYRGGSAPVACYDERKVLEALVKEGLTYGQALEHYARHIQSSWKGEQSPVFLRPL